MFYIRTVTALLLIVGVVAGCAKTQPLQTHYIPPEKGVSVWIDTDPACGKLLVNSDPDDCLAYILAKRAGVDIVGISTVGGNAREEDTWEVAQTLVADHSKLHRGIGGCNSDAVIALERESKLNRLRILALGPLTNIATWVACNPDAKNRISEIIFIGSRQKGQKFIPNKNWLFTPELSDLNVEKDEKATQTILNSRIPIVFIPFEAGNAVPIAYASVLDVGISLPEEIETRLRSWSARFWLFAGTNGFLPFDPVAVAYLLWPDEFLCKKVTPEVTSNQLLVQFTKKETPYTYCVPKDSSHIRSLILLTLKKRSHSD